MTVPPVKVEFGFGSTWQTEPASITWTDETAYVLQPQRIEASRGASSARGEVDAGIMSLTLKSSDRRFDPTYTSGTHYGNLNPGVPVRVTRESSYLLLPGAVGDYASTPDKAALDITGDIDLRVHCALDDWTPASAMVLCSNISTSAFTGYDIQIGTLAFPALRWGDGAAVKTANATAALSTANGSPTWVRATLDVNDGSGNHVVKFYTSDDGANWTQLGATVTTAGTTSIAASAQPFYVGIRATSLTLPAAGKFYRAQVLNGIGGTLVVDTDFTVQTAGATTFSDDLSNTWTVTAGTTAAITADTGIPVWYGHVAKWPQRYEPGGFSWVPVECYDGFDKLSRAKIPRSVMEKEILADSPVAYWPLDETSGRQMVDRSGNGRHGTYTQGTTALSQERGDSAPILGLLLDGEHFGEVRQTAAALSDRPGVIEAVIAPDADGTDGGRVVQGGTGNADAGSIMSINYSLSPGFWKATTSVIDGDADNVTISEAHNFDGVPAHVAYRRPASGAAVTYHNGVDDTLSTTTTSVGAAEAPGVAVGAARAGDALEWGYSGFAAHVAIFDTDIGATRIAAHSDAALAPLDGQTTDERVGWILDELDWPANLRDFETGRSTLGPATFKPGDNALEYLRLVTRSEDGLLFTEPDGTLRFLDRYWRYLDALATGVQFTFSDAAQSYAEFQLDLDDELLVNTARLTRRNGTEQVASDTTSVNTYGEAELSYGDLLLQTDNEVLSLAEWKVATGKDPLPRVPSIKVPLHDYSTTNQGKVLRLDLGHRVRCVRTPDTGSAITLDFLIAGVRHSIGGGEWWWEAFVTPVPEDTVNVFRWDVSTWDGSDVWAY